MARAVAGQRVRYCGYGFYPTSYHVNVASQEDDELRRYDLLALIGHLQTFGRFFHGALRVVPCPLRLHIFPDGAFALAG